MVRARTLERYLARQIYGATGFVLVGFLALFAFFDLIGELGDLGKGEYDLRQVFTFVALNAPAHVYELFPIVVLIGTLYVLSQLASNSEYTVMRGSGLSPAHAALCAAARSAWPSWSLTFVIGEWIAPFAEETAQQTKIRALSSMIGQDLQSGLWFKDEGSFINVREARQANSLQGVRIFEFDTDYRLRKHDRWRERAEFRGKGLWQLYDVVATHIQPGRAAHRARQGGRVALGGVARPADALIVKPERMSAWALHKYTQHLAGNRQKTERYEIALWKKLFYPLATLVMMALALPFAYMHARAGRGRRQGVPRHHARHLLPHAEQPVLAHRPAEELAAARRRGGAERRVPRVGAADDVVGGAPLGEARRVPASRSCRNCRSRSTSAQRIDKRQAAPRRSGSARRLAGRDVDQPDLPRPHGERLAAAQPAPQEVGGEHERG